MMEIIDEINKTNVVLEKYCLAVSARMSGWISDDSYDKISKQYREENEAYIFNYPNTVCHTRTMEIIKGRIDFFENKYEKYSGECYGKCDGNCCDYSAIEYQIKKLKMILSGDLKSWMDLEQKKMNLHK